MATIAEHVSALRALIATHSDDDNLTDDAIYHVFNTAANRLQVQKNRRWNHISDWNFKRYCLGVEKTKSHNCDCVPVGCNVLKTTFSVPKPLTSRNRDLIRVFDLQNREIYRVTENEQITNQLDEVKKGKVTYSLIDQKIVLWNALVGDLETPKYKAIEISMMPEDVTDFAGITLCDSAGDPTGINCFNIDEDDYTLDTELVYPAYQMALELLGIRVQLVDDRMNDAAEAKG